MEWFYGRKRCAASLMRAVVAFRAAVKFGNKIWGNHTVMTYLKTGVFDYWVPVGRPVHWEVSAADFRLRTLTPLKATGSMHAPLIQWSATCALRCLRSDFSSRPRLCLSLGSCINSSYQHLFWEGQPIEGPKMELSTCM